MLEQIQIRNFQGHRKYRVKFDKVTTIVGPSDAGKSSFIRALKWVCLNQPQGDSFVRIGAEFASVRLFVDDVVIKRKRGKGVNSYWLDKEEFKAFGSGVPGPVEDVLNVDEINFQDQHDPPFWFGLNAGEVSKRLNAVVDLSIIDRCLASASKKTRQLQSVVDVSKNRLAKALSTREELEWIQEADQDWQAVELIEKKIEETQVDSEYLEDLLTKAKTERRNRNRYRSYAKDLTVLSKKVQRLSVLQFSKTSLETCLNEIERIRSLRSRIPSTKAMDTALSKAENVQASCQSLEGLLEGIESAQDDLKFKRDEAEKAERQLHKELKGKCPVCGSNL